MNFDISPDQIVAYAGAIAIGLAAIGVGLGTGLGFAIAIGSRILDNLMRTRR